MSNIAYSASGGKTSGASKRHETQIRRMSMRKWRMYIALGPLFAGLPRSIPIGIQWRRIELSRPCCDAMETATEFDKVQSQRL